MSLSNNKVLSIAIWAAAALLLALLLLPESRPALPQPVFVPPTLGQNASGPSQSPERERRLQASISPARMAERFYAPAKRAPAPAAATPSPKADPSPAAVEKPLPTNELRFIGTVQVDGQSKWALYDSLRQVSFTIAPGESWSDWTCLGSDNATITMRKHEKTYSVPRNK